MTDKTAELMESILYEVKRVVVGQDRFLERVLVALLAEGHLLVEGVPGLAKTLTVKTLARTVGGSFRRIQFTPDLVPADLVGTRIFNQKSGEFGTSLGPVFANLLLADEINRAAPKVQSALLEAMQERRVTIGNNNYALPAPFLVIATQNPVEQAGTFELPEAQLDRFMLLHRLEYLKPEEEKEVLRRNTKLGVRREGKGAVARTEFDVLDGQERGTSDQLVRAMEDVQQVHVSEAFLEHVVEIVNRTRNHPKLELGCSPRAGISLVKASRARALIHGRDYVLPEDLFALAEDVILHRIRLSYEAVAEGHTSQQVLQEILGEVAR